MKNTQKTIAEYVAEALASIEAMTPSEKAAFAKEVSEGFNDQVNS